MLPSDVLNKVTAAILQSNYQLHALQTWNSKPKPPENMLHTTPSSKPLRHCQHAGIFIFIFESAILTCCMAGNQHSGTDGITAAVAPNTGLLNIVLSHVLLNKVLSAIFQPPRHQFISNRSWGRDGKAENSTWTFLLGGCSQKNHLTLPSISLPLKTIIRTQNSPIPLSSQKYRIRQCICKVLQNTVYISEKVLLLLRPVNRSLTQPHLADKVLQCGVCD